MGFMRRFLPLLSLFGLLVSLSIPVPSSAQGSDAVQPSPAASPQSVKAFLEDAVNKERSNLVEIEESLKRWEALKTTVEKELESYRIQNTAHNNLLLVSETRVGDLEATLNNNRLIIKSLADRIAEFEKIGGVAAGRMTQLADRITIAEMQLDNLQQETLSDDNRREMREKLANLIGILQANKQRGEDFLKTYRKLFGQLKSMMTELTETRRRLEERFQLAVKSNLYERAALPLNRLGLANLRTELTAVGERMGGFFRPAFWDQQLVNFQRSGGVSQTVFLVLLVMAVGFRRKIRRYLRSIETRLEAPAWRQRRLALIMLRRSFLLIWAAVLLLLYDVLKLPSANINLPRFLNHVVFTLLLARWGIDFLQMGEDNSGTELQRYARLRLVHILQLLRMAVVSYLTLILVIGGGSIVVWGVRLMLEVALLVWVIHFWQGFSPVVVQGVRKGENAPSAARVLVVRIWSYLVAGGAVLMELTGYGALAGHWLVSWAETLLFALWAHIGWQAIQEWYGVQKTTAMAREDAPEAPVAAPVGWFVVQMARLVWLGAVLAGGLLVWSSTAFMTATLEQIFNLAFSVGSLSISVKGVLLAVVIVCATQVAVKVGRRLLREKVLASKDLDRGLKDSIITITSYVVWGLSLLLILGVLGVNATSLAVVAGALSIGIGFGLQNIFNNFISGLILLFERPIQVGDFVEVNGLWAEVKQINVRSTIVQTFDNASVIIPNSDFISQQVTNWSFKDPRMRRQVDVGVAYGSDIELVRKTLLEIAAQTPQILKYPRPDVLFVDHGDSALLFRLRFWTHVENYWSTTTDVRFELDRRFRELGIEIAFPQRDLHIRSVDPRIFAQATAASPSPVSSHAHRSAPEQQ